MLGWRNAAVVDLHDVGVAQCSHGLRFPEKALAVMPTGINPGEQHLERNRAVQAQLEGFVDDSHAASTEDGIHLIARNIRQLGYEVLEELGPGGMGLGSSGLDAL
jgi:hypothetical protein